MMGCVLDSSANGSNGLLAGPFQFWGKSLRSLQQSAAPGRQLRASLMTRLYADIAFFSASTRRNQPTLRRYRGLKASETGPVRERDPTLPVLSRFRCCLFSFLFVCFLCAL